MFHKKVVGFQVIRYTWHLYGSSIPIPIPISFVAPRDHAIVNEIFRSAGFTSTTYVPLPTASTREDLRPHLSQFLSTTYRQASASSFQILSRTFRVIFREIRTSCTFSCHFLFRDTERYLNHDFGRLDDSLTSSFPHCSRLREPLRRAPIGRAGLARGLAKQFFMRTDLKVLEINSSYITHATSLWFDFNLRNFAGRTSWCRFSGNLIDKERRIREQTLLREGLYWRRWGNFSQRRELRDYWMYRTEKASSSKSSSLILRGVGLLASWKSPSGRGLLSDHPNTPRLCDPE